MGKGWVLLGVAALLLTTGCSTTWVDDDGNFKRMFGFDKPPDVIVLHSYYWQAPRWSGTSEVRYFIVMRGTDKFAHDMVAHESGNVMVADPNARNGCGNTPPSWFVPKRPDRYELWVLKESAGVRVFRDKDDNTIHVCAGRH